VDVNLEKMFTFLKVVKNEITSIKAEVGEDVSVEEVTEALTEGFGKALNVKLENGELTAYERMLAKNFTKKNTPQLTGTYTG
jgi:lipoate-protein ligase A